MSDERAALRIVHGAPTPEELAAVAAVVSAVAGGESTEPEPPLRGRWADPSVMHRRPWHSGPGAWRAAFR
jgi:acyl-CoA carboxylase epsilon subunit